MSITSTNFSDDYQSPSALTDNETLTAQEKIELLREWKLQLEEELIAGDEGMFPPASQAADELKAVQDCLQYLAGSD